MSLVNILGDLNDDDIVEDSGHFVFNNKSIKLKSSNTKKKKQTKKENKLLLTFVQRFLPEKQEEICAQLKCNFNNNQSRNLLLDNRDYQLTICTEQLVETINEIDSESKNIVEDVFVLPSKTFVLIRFNTEDSCLRIKNILQSDDDGRDLIKSSSLPYLNVVLLSDFIYDSCVEKFLPSVTELIRLFTDQPPGLELYNDFITYDEEKNLIRFAEQCFSDSSNKVSHLRNRESVHFGFVFSYKLNTIVNNDESTMNQDSTVVIDQQLPQQCRFVIDRLLKDRILTEIPDQMTINRYHGQNGDHIPLHVDTHSMCTNWLASLSIGSDTVMTFENPREILEDNQIRKTYLRNRSLMMMKDEARYLWRHGIAQTSVDIVPLDSQLQTSLTNSSRSARLSLCPRGERFSIIFRKTTSPGYSCQCSFTESCDSQQKPQPAKTEVPDMAPSIDSSQVLTDTVAQQLESEYVHQTYDKIAEHFSSTRYACWPKVSEFVNSLEPGSLLLDVGCGNGKYLSVNTENVVSIGTDRSEKLLEICRRRDFEVFQDNCLTVARTLRSGLFDAVISIAVIHHLASEERRLKAIESIVDLLQTNGKALIYVWAFEQKRSGSSSKYLRPKHGSNGNAGVNVNSTDHDDKQNEIRLKVHQNRTEFKQQDLFVPWTKTKSATPNLKPVESEESTNLRFYHVFREGELQQLLCKLNNISIEQIYYDQGNWCSIIRKTDNLN